MITSILSHKLQRHNRFLLPAPGAASRNGVGFMQISNKVFRCTSGGIGTSAVAVFKWQLLINAEYFFLVHFLINFESEY